jgi:hypothetical protein
MGNDSSSPSWSVSCIENLDTEHPSIEYEEESENVQCIWEFQRYKNGVGWGAGDNFEGGDPGRFSSFDQKAFGNTLQVMLLIILSSSEKSVDPGVPQGFKIDLGWSVVFHKKVSDYKKGIGYIDETSISDRFGWYYAKSFAADKWSSDDDRCFLH